MGVNDLVEGGGVGVSDLWLREEGWELVVFTLREDCL